MSEHASLFSVDIGSAQSGSDVSHNGVGHERRVPCPFGRPCPPNRLCYCSDIKTEAPVSGGLLAATQRRDVSRFRVCRGVLEAALHEFPAITVGSAMSLGRPHLQYARALNVIRDLPDLVTRLRLLDGFRERRKEDARTASKLPTKQLEHLEPPCSRTVTRGASHAGP